MLVWKEISGYDGKYLISNNGLIKSTKGKDKILRGSFDGRYKRVLLYKNSRYKIFYIHRLVAEYFIENPSQKKEVNHIDGNRLNNNFRNLQWVTPKENSIHAIKSGLKKSFGSFSIEKTFLIALLVKDGFRQKEIASYLGVSQSFVSLVGLEKLKLYTRN